MSTSTFPVNPELTAVAIGYRNPDEALIADSVLPRVPVGQQFKWTKYNQQDGYTVPDTKVGRKSEPTVVDFGGTMVTDATADYGLDDVVPNEDIEAWEKMSKPQSGGPVNPLMIATMQLTNLVNLAREIRVAAVVFNSANYTYNTTLSGTSQWSDYTNSNPISAIMTALDIPLIRPNKMTIGRAAYTVLRQHPKVVQAIYKTQQGAGTVSKQQLAELLEIDEILVGSGFVNTATKGQTPVYARVWGKHCAFHYTSLQAAQMLQPTYGWTGQFGSKIAGAIPEPKIGLSGSQRVRVGEKLKELVACPDVAYYFQNCVA